MATRLSRLETLPPDALPAAQWAWDAIRARRMTHLAILEQLNARLAETGLKPISHSGFNRFAIRVNEGLVARPADISAEPPREPHYATPTPADRQLLDLAVAVIEPLRGRPLDQVEGVLNLAAALARLRAQMSSELSRPSGSDRPTLTPETPAFP